MDGGKVMVSTGFESWGVRLESTLSITMQKEFYLLFGGVIKLSERREYLPTLRRSILVIDKEYWDTNTREVYKIELTIIDLIKLMAESVKKRENKLFIIVQMQNQKKEERDCFYEIKKENGKAYIKEEKKGLRKLIKRIFKKVICL